MQKDTPISFFDSKLKNALIAILAQQRKETGNEMLSLSAVARPIFAIGLAAVKARPELLSEALGDGEGE